MDRKQIEDREALKTAAEALDAPGPDEGAVPKGGVATATQSTAAASETAGSLPPEEIDRLTTDIVAALKTVYDPEIPVDIYELGLIYGVDISEDGDATITMTLTTPHCPVAESLPQEVELRAMSVPGIRDAVVNLVWDPPWDPSKMSDEARLELGML